MSETGDSGKKTKLTLRQILTGKRYFTFTNINDQAKYLILNFVFLISMVPLIFFGFTSLNVDPTRTILDFSFAFLLLVSLLLTRSKFSLKAIPLVIVPIFGAYTLFLLMQGTLYLWTAVWIFTFPIIAVILCQMIAGVIQSTLVLAGAIAIMYVPGIAKFHVEKDIRSRFIIAYFLIMSLAVIYERISMIKDKKEAALNAELTHEKDVIQTMQDNIHQGIFLMDADLKILPGYSKPLISILSFNDSDYDSELAGKNFLDILAASLDTKQLQSMKDYFSMFFSKAKAAKVPESANPIAEFERRIEDSAKTLATQFHLIEQSETGPAIIGIIQDITKEKEHERDLQAQREAQVLEMKNMLDILQLDPLVFNDFIEDTESNFKYINSILQDRSLTEKQVLAKFSRTVHAIKSNALILGLETFGEKLLALEDEIKVISDYNKIIVEDILGLTIKLENILKEKDSYIKLAKKIETLKSSNQVDTILFHTLEKAVEKVSAETKKQVELKAEQLDIVILESRLRKPIKEILFQCARNSIYHGIEPPDERIKKNKKPVGLLAFSIKNVGGKAEVTFSDDGRGLDWEKIKARYTAMHPETTTIDKKTLLAAIFKPEFSNNERGVGLCFVKNLVKENQGIIKVYSAESGLTFKFIFPIPDAA